PGANVEGWTPGIRRRGRVEAPAALPPEFDAGFASASTQVLPTTASDTPTMAYSAPAPSVAAYPAPTGQPASRSELNRLAQEAAASAGRSSYGQAEPEPAELHEISL